MADNTLEYLEEQKTDQFMLCLQYLNMSTIIVAHTTNECNLTFGFATVPESIDDMRELVEMLTNGRDKGLIMPYCVDIVSGYRDYVPSGFLLTRLISAHYFLVRANRASVVTIPDIVDGIRYALSTVNTMGRRLTLECWYNVDPVYYMRPNRETGEMDVDNTLYGPQMDRTMLVGYTRILRLPAERDRNGLIYDKAYVIATVSNGVYTVRVINLIMHYIRRKMAVWIKRVRDRLVARVVYKMMHTKYAGMFPYIHAVKRERDF